MVKLFPRFNTEEEEFTFYPADIDLDREFDDGYGGTEGEPFYAWSRDWVVFPVCYDGSEWLGRVPRNPTNEQEPHHFGGG